MNWHCPDCGTELEECTGEMWCPNDECAVAYAAVAAEEP